MPQLSVCSLCVCPSLAMRSGGQCHTALLEKWRARYPWLGSALNQQYFLCKHDVVQTSDSWFGNCTASPSQITNHTITVAPLVKLNGVNESIMQNQSHPSGPFVQEVPQCETSCCIIGICVHASIVPGNRQWFCREYYGTVAMHCLRVYFCTM